MPWFKLPLPTVQQAADSWSIFEVAYDTDPYMADAHEQPQRKRARQACLACNSRRVKCNVTEKQPCDNCVAGNVACETRESRRGKHPRPSKRARQGSDGTSIPSPTIRRPSHSQHDALDGANILASLHRNRPGDGFNGDLPDVGTFMKTEQHISPTEDSGKEDDGDDVFLGEANALRYVHDEPPAQQRTPSPLYKPRFRYSVPNGLKADALIPPWEAQRRQKRIHDLKEEGAFSLPAVGVVEGLLKAYFQWFHPCFAIVDEIDIWTQRRAGTLSPLLLQAMLFVGVLHCEEQVLTDLNHGSRHRAKFVFYNRAKDIYDADYETRKITVIQALFLMSFIRAGALLEKDTRHWLGAAISLAQSKALHRSAGRAENQVAKLRRRIWWSLYTRDRQCAAALGLPNRIRDEDCDFESMELTDFDHAYGPNVSKKDAEEFATYAVGMTELAKILGQIVHTGYLPNKTLSSSHRALMKEKLTRWKQRLPPTMQPDTEPGQNPSFYAHMQHLAYNNLLILLYRQEFIGNENDNSKGEGSVALQAAARNTRIVEDMLSTGNLRHSQIHTITNLFNTLCIHTVQLRQSEGSTKAVAELRAKLCLHGLQELQKTWEVTNWVLQLFFHYLDRATAASLQVQQEGDPPTGVLGQLTNDPSIATYAAVAEAATRAHPLATIPEAVGVAQQPTAPNHSTTPWSWTSDEANQFLFSQIENEFAFGEGEILNWSPEEFAFDETIWHNGSSGNQYVP